MQRGTRRCLRCRRRRWLMLPPPGICKVQSITLMLPVPFVPVFVPGCVTRMKRFFCAERKVLHQTKKARRNDKRVRWGWLWFMQSQRLTFFSQSSIDIYYNDENSQLGLNWFGRIRNWYLFSICNFIKHIWVKMSKLCSNMSDNM